MTASLEQQRSQDLNQLAQLAKALTLFELSYSVSGAADDQFRNVKARDAKFRPQLDAALKNAFGVTAHLGSTRLNTQRTFPQAVTGIEIVRVAADNHPHLKVIAQHFRADIVAAGKAIIEARPVARVTGIDASARLSAGYSDATPESPNQIVKAPAVQKFEAAMSDLATRLGSPLLAPALGRAVSLLVLENDLERVPSHRTAIVNAEDRHRVTSGRMGNRADRDAAFWYMLGRDPESALGELSKRSSLKLEAQEFRAVIALSDYACAEAEIVTTLAAIGNVPAGRDGYELRYAYEAVDPVDDTELRPAENPNFASLFGFTEKDLAFNQRHLSLLGGTRPTMADIGF